MKFIFRTIHGKRIASRKLPFVPIVVPSGLAKVTINKGTYLVHAIEYDYDKMIVTVTCGDY